MTQTTRDITEIQTKAVETDESIEANGAQPNAFGAPSSHPDPERERLLDALLERAWPKIKASMYYLRDRQVPPQDPDSDDASGSLEHAPSWLDFDDILRIHTVAMYAMDERPRPVIDESRLRSKLTRPMNAYHYEEVRDPFLLGAMVAVAISQAHGFEDGNKRTALASMAVFLGSLGYDIDVLDESVGAWLITIAEAHDRDRDAKTEEFAAWLRQATSPMPQRNRRDPSSRSG